MEIVAYGDPRLRERCKVVDMEDRALVSSLLSDAEAMADAMYESNGCGMAHPQIGGGYRVIVVDCSWDAETGEGKDPLVMFNPEVASASEKREKKAEGCLSVPGINVFVERPSAVCVTYMDAEGNEKRIESPGLLARCLQHEIDHLDGITMIEHLAGAKKLQALSSLAAAKKMGVSPGEPAPYVIR